MVMQGFSSFVLIIICIRNYSNGGNSGEDGPRRSSRWSRLKARTPRSQRVAFQVALFTVGQSAGPWALGAEDGGEGWCPSAPVTLRVLREDSVTRGRLAGWRGQSSVAPLFASDASGSVLPSLRSWS